MNDQPAQEKPTLSRRAALKTLVAASGAAALLQYQTAGPDY